MCARPDSCCVFDEIAQPYQVIRSRRKREQSVDTLTRLTNYLHIDLSRALRYPSSYQAVDKPVFSKNSCCIESTGSLRCAMSGACFLLLATWSSRSPSPTRPTPGVAPHYAGAGISFGRRFTLSSQPIR